MFIVLIGYLASALLALSLLVTNDRQFRWFNLFGCVAFILYGALIGAVPVLLTNALLFLINLYYLVKIYRTAEAFELAEAKPEDEILAKFLRFYQKDIATYFPAFKPEAATGAICFVVLRDMVLTTVFMATPESDGTGNVLIDYTIPKYRDYGAGHFIFGAQKGYLRSKGMRQLVYRQPVSQKHESFLKRMGFVKEAGVFTKHLA